MSKIHFLFHKLLILFLIITVIVSCVKQSAVNIETVSLSKTKSFTQFNDTCFLSDMVLGLERYNQNYLVSDYQRSHVLVLNTNFELEQIIANRGQGPGELLGAAGLHVSGDKLYAVNDGNNSIDCFEINSGKFRSSIKFPEGYNKTIQTSFFEHNGLLYHTIVESDSLILVFNEVGEVKNRYGVKTKWDNSDFRLHSTRHLIKGNKSFYEIGFALPVFQEYSFDGKLLQTFDLSAIPEVQKQMNVYKNSPQKPNTYFSMIPYVYACKQNIYLLFATNVDAYYSNKVVVINTENGLKHTATYSLDSGRIYSSILVDNDTIIAFNSLTAGLDIYSFKK